jgi:hypothetical protein
MRSDKTVERIESSIRAFIMTGLFLVFPRSAAILRPISPLIA